jgi:hypothetical protein
MQENAVVVATAINNRESFNCLTSVFIVLEVARTNCRKPLICRAHDIERSGWMDLCK